MSNWKEIPDAPGYFVSRFGDVFSTKSGRVLNFGDDGKGYLRGRVGGRLRRLHEIVALAWIGPRPDGFEVCHINGKHRDNRVENLRYGSHRENMADRCRHGATAKGRRIPASKLTPDDVVAIRRDPRLHKVIAEEYGIDPSAISRIKSRKVWKHV